MRTDQVQVIIPCVDYEDLLRQSLPVTRQLFHNVLVVSSAEDEDTIALCQRAKVDLLLTNAWFDDGARLNKAAALNEAIAVSLQRSPYAWLLVLDADIVLSNHFDLDVAALDPSCLYSVRRRLCETEHQWKQISDGTLTPGDLPIYTVPVTNGKAWGHRPAENPAALSGYFQLWHPTTTQITRFPPKPSAAGYDVEFALMFPDERRYYLSGEAVHLGPLRKNWNGRVSPRWATVSAGTPLPARASFILKELHRLGILDTMEFAGERLPGSKNSVFALRAKFRTWYLKMFLERERARLATEHLGLREFSNVVVVPRMVASSLEQTMSGAPFLLTEALPETFSPIASHPPGAWIEPIASHFERRQWENFGQRISGTGAPRSFRQICKARINSAKYIDRELQAHSRGLRAFSSELLSLLSAELTRISPDRPVSFQHGDFSPANVFVQADGALALLDFELARWDDYCGDIFYFCNCLLDESEDCAPEIRGLFARLHRSTPGVTESAAWTFWSIGRWYDSADHLFRNAAPEARKPDLVELLLERGQRLVARMGRGQSIV